MRVGKSISLSFARAISLTKSLKIIAHAIPSPDNNTFPLVSEYGLFVITGASFNYQH